jgi:hypothetical protein|nr:MAG TPA: hypothetical protein [Caudoviricetes sp.]
MKTIFEKGDKVFDIRFSWGIINYLYSTDWEKEKNENLVCNVKFENGEEVHYSKKVASKLLSFTEYTLKGFTQIHKKDFSQYIGKWCRFKHKYDKDYFYLCILSSIDEKGNFYDSEGDDWDYCEPLTDEQIKILGLE